MTVDVDSLINFQMCLKNTQFKVGHNSQVVEYSTMVSSHKLDFSKWVSKLLTSKATTSHINDQRHSIDCSHCVGNNNLLNVDPLIVQLV